VLTDTVSQLAEMLNKSSMALDSLQAKMTTFDETHAAIDKLGASIQHLLRVPDASQQESDEPVEISAEEANAAPSARKRSRRRA